MLTAEEEMEIAVPRPIGLRSANRITSPSDRSAKRSPTHSIQR